MRIGLMWILAGVLMSHAVVEASDSQADRATLAGLTSMSVVVEELAPIAEKSGLSGTTLQSGIERRLRQAGVSITSDADAYLYVRVTVADPGASTPLPYLVEVSLMQEVTLPRGLRTRAPLQCPTWGVNRLGMVGPEGLGTIVNQNLNEFVDQFVRAYQSVNPKP